MAFFIFTLGLLIGSFLNVLADRLPKDESILGRSRCEYCHRTLKWYDLIPLVSYIWLKGKCGYCHRQLSVQYPLSELISGSIFFGVSLINGNIPQLTINLILSSSLMVIFLSDLKYRIIPDKILFPAVLIEVIYLFVFQIQQFSNHLIAGFICFIFFLFIFVFTRGRGMGFGDVKFAFLIGIFLGIPLSFAALYLAFLTGGAAGIILILWRKKGLKSRVSFGPFLVLGTFLAFFLQTPILRLISNYFG